MLDKWFPLTLTDASLHPVHVVDHGVLPFAQEPDVVASGGKATPSGISIIIIVSICCYAVLLFSCLLYLTNKTTA